MASGLICPGKKTEKGGGNTQISEVIHEARIVTSDVQAMGLRESKVKENHKM